MSTVVAQIWEGTVVHYEQGAGDMTCLLRDRTGKLDDISATIELIEVPYQDRELVTPGAVFYLTMYRESRRGTVGNVQKISFRRIPGWNKAQVDEIHNVARQIWSSFEQPTEFDPLDQD